jgi:hypothetical protein
MKTRKHHNNKGNKQVRTGKVKEQVDKIAKKFFKWVKRNEEKDKGQENKKAC